MLNLPGAPLATDYATMADPTLVGRPKQDSMDAELLSIIQHTPAYRALHENNLLCNEYLVHNVQDLRLNTRSWNWSPCPFCTLRCASCCGCLGCNKYFVVNGGCVRKGMHINGEYTFFGEGMHVTSEFFTSVEDEDVRLNNGAIIHGTKAIVIVSQGFIGLAMDRGQPMLLPPGLHQWDSQSVEFKELIDLSSSLIRLGPYTLVTVDEGYAAITQDNGEQKILEGGSSYMLTHRNWKFEKFMTKKIQTDDVGPVAVTTGDNVPLTATATVNWIISDAKLAARMAAQTMENEKNSSGKNNKLTEEETSMQFDITAIRQDVIRQVTSSLAAFVGSVNYSAHGHANMAAVVDGTQKKNTAAQEPEPAPGVDTRRVLFDPARLFSSVDHANDICHRYGVSILSINLISAAPSDHGLLEALSKGAVATVAAEQTQTAARGEAQAMLLKAKAEAESARIRAEGDAQAEEIRAEGSLQAAQRLQGSDVAVQLAKLKTAGACLRDTQANSFFFGLKGAGDIPQGLLGNALAGDSKRGIFS